MFLRIISDNAPLPFGSVWRAVSYQFQWVTVMDANGATYRVRADHTEYAKTEA